MNQPIAEIIVAEHELAERVDELAARISRDYAGEEIVLVGILKGAVFFLADLARRITVPVALDFMGVSSYGSATNSSGVVRILKDLDSDITGRHVIIVEDVIDSGLTVGYLLKSLWSRNPASLEVCTLLSKPSSKQSKLACKYTGFEIPDLYVVGYGLDLADRYRTFRFIGALTPEAIAEIVDHEGSLL